MAARQNKAGGSFMPAVCKKADLSVILNVSTRTITDYDQRGLLVRAETRATYQTLPSIHGVLKELREQAAGRGTSTGYNLADERAKTEMVSRELQEIKLKQLKGEVLTLDEVSQSWSRFAAIVKQSVMSLPSKVRATIPHLTAHDGELVRDLCREILEDAAEEVEDTVIGGDRDDIQPSK